MIAKTVELKTEPRQFSNLKWLRYVQEAAIPLNDSFTEYKLALRKPSIHTAAIPDFENLMKEGESLGSGRIGSLRYLRRIRVSPKEAIGVDEQEFAFGSPEIPNSRFLVTYGIQTYVAIAAYNPKQKVGLLAHAFHAVNAHDAIEKALDLVEASTIVLVGGVKGSSLSKTTVAIAEALIARNRSRITLVGKDTLTAEHPPSIGIDTETGEIFLPVNEIDYHGDSTYDLQKSVFLNFTGNDMWNSADKIIRSVPVAVERKNRMATALS